jgi:hypothetical protein
MTLMQEIVAYWNLRAVPEGFAKVTKISLARGRTLKVAIKERPYLTEWVKAIQRYTADAKRWPERVKYGFDTFIRPSQRDKWFDGPDAQSSPADMDEDQADDYYTKDMR